MRAVQILILSLLFVACGNTKKTANQEINLDDEATLILSYSQNSGNNSTDPEYEIKLFSNRQMYLNAKRNLDVEGKHLRTLSESEYKQLLNAFIEANFFDFKDAYTADMTNLPTRYIYFSHNGKEKKIMDYYDAPEDLKELELLVQSFLDRVGWVKMTW